MVGFLNSFGLIEVGKYIGVGSNNMERCIVHSHSWGSSTSFRSGVSIYGKGYWSSLGRRVLPSLFFSIVMVLVYSSCSHRGLISRLVCTKKFEAVHIICRIYSSALER